MKTKTISKKSLLLSMVLMMFLALPGTVFASGQASPALAGDGIITPYFVGISTISYALNIKDGQANPVVTGTTYQNAVDYVNVQLDLKRSSNGTSWSTIKSWNKDITVSSQTFTFNEKYTVSKNYSYKFTATVKSYKNSALLDTVTFDSNTVSY